MDPHLVCWLAEHPKVLQHILGCLKNYPYNVVVLISLRYGASQFHPRVMLRRKEEARILTYMFLFAGYPAQSLPKRNTGWWFETCFIVPFSWEFHHPNWRTPSFFRGVGQPPTSPLLILILSNYIMHSISHYPLLFIIIHYYPLLSIIRCHSYSILYPKPRIHKPLVIEAMILSH